MLSWIPARQPRHRRCGPLPHGGRRAAGRAPRRHHHPECPAQQKEPGGRQRHILGVVMNGYNGKQSGRRDGYSYAYSYSYYDEDKKGNDA